MSLKERHGRLRAIDLANLIVTLFPAFQDQVDYQGRRCQSLNCASIDPSAELSTVFFWKRAQILIAETWSVTQVFPFDRHSYLLLGLLSSRVMTRSRIPYFQTV
jgi:Potential Queuosine, Q, salvage protein family